MSGIMAKRVAREIKDLQSAAIEGCSCAQTGDDIHHWRASLVGPEGSPYEGGTFEFEITLPNDCADRMATDAKPCRPVQTAARQGINPTLSL